MKEIFWKHLTINHFSLLENEVLAWHCQRRTGHLFSLSLFIPAPSLLSQYLSLWQVNGWSVSCLSLLLHAVFQLGAGLLT